MRRLIPTRLARACCVQPLSLRKKRILFFIECLVLPGVGNGESERVNGNQFIRDFAAKNENEIGGVELSLKLAVVYGRVVHHIEVHTGAIRRVLEAFKGNVLNVNVDLGRGRVRKESLYDRAFLVGVENAIRQAAVEEVER